MLFRSVSQSRYEMYDKKKEKWYQKEYRADDFSMEEIDKALNEYVANLIAKFKTIKGGAARALGVSSLSNKQALAVLEEGLRAGKSVDEIVATARMAVTGTLIPQQELEIPSSFGRIPPKKGPRGGSGGKPGEDKLFWTDIVDAQGKPMPITREQANRMFETAQGLVTLKLAPGTLQALREEIQAGIGMITVQTRAGSSTQGGGATVGEGQPMAGGARPMTGPANEPTTRRRVTPEEQKLLQKKLLIKFQN